MSRFLESNEKRTETTLDRPIPVHSWWAYDRRWGGDDQRSNPTVGGEAPMEMIFSALSERDNGKWQGCRTCNAGHLQQESRRGE